VSAELGRPVLDGLYEEGLEGVRLLGSRCPACGTPAFPRAPRCRNPRCGTTSVDDASFAGPGVLYSFTVQHYRPPAPVLADEPFVPYALGWVDLSDGLRVLGRLTTTDLGVLRLDMKVDLVAGPIGRDEDGVQRMAWMFAPVADELRAI
jgi:uncharacterized protein